MSAPGTIRTRDLAGRNGSLYPLSYGGNDSTLAARDARFEPTDLPANVLSKISTDCWSWTGATQSSGYGSIGIAGQTYLAHRHVYTLAVGPIPDGYEVDHTCRNPRCVNPAHLEAVTPEENRRRRNEAYAECKRGHALDGDNVRVHRRSNGTTTRECRACGIETQRRAAEKRLGRQPRTHSGRIDTTRLGTAS